MKTESEIKKDVEEELRCDPDIDSTEIAVGINHNAVMLSGFVKSFSDKHKAELDAKRVAGVIAIANDIEVRLPSAAQRPDPEIAHDAVNALQAQLPLSGQNVKVTIEDGWLTLDGSVDSYFKRERAHDAVLYLKGVKGIINKIEVRPRVLPSQIKQKVEEAFRRNAAVYPGNIQVEAIDGEVTLKGTVHYWYEREEAERAAWAVPGVTKVEDHIAIKP